MATIIQQLSFSIACIQAIMSRQLGLTVSRLPVPKIAFVLGSAQNDMVKLLDPLTTVSIPFDEISGFASPKVEGHSGTLHIGMLHGVWVALLAGRPHYYEGNEPDAVVHPVRTMIELGVETLILTNAAGSVNPDRPTGTIMILSDHMALLSGVQVLRGPNEDKLGARFPSPANGHPKALIDLADQVCGGLGFEHRFWFHGTYAMVSGPCYESPADARAVHILGADAVGMSTVPEIRAAVHMGFTRILSIALITNSAGEKDLDHATIMQHVGAGKDRMIQLLEELARRLGAET